MNNFNKIVLLLDSFKGSISSKELSSIGKAVINNKIKDIEITAASIADGGEGTTSFFIDELGYQPVKVNSVNAFFEPLETRFAVKDDKAVFDVASIVGFDVCDHLDILNASTYGIGLVLKEMIKAGYKNIYLGLGGSITNDGGVGILEALGAKFYFNEELVELHKTPFKMINKADLTTVFETLKGISITALCDVVNPLLGPSGATAIFSPQKGSNEATRTIMENWMTIYANVLNGNKDAHGAGAAGGIGYMINLVGGKLEKGIDVLLNEFGICDKLDENTLLITGEGALDKTSFSGKVVGKMVELTKTYHNNLIIMCGIDNYKESIYKVYPLHDMPCPNFKETVHEDVENTFKKILKDIIPYYANLKFKVDAPISSGLKDLRYKVFVKEQNVAEDIEFDELDETANHFKLLLDEEIIAGGRITDLDGMAKIGRVVVDKAYRGLGIGLIIMNNLVKEAKKLEYQKIIVFAQTYAIDFYKKCGFVPFGDKFFEAGIEHIKMMYEETTN